MKYMRLILMILFLNILIGCEFNSKQKVVFEIEINDKDSLKEHLKSEFLKLGFDDYRYSTDMRLAPSDYEVDNLENFAFLTGEPYEGKLGMERHYVSVSLIEFKNLAAIIEFTTKSFRTENFVLSETLVLAFDSGCCLSDREKEYAYHLVKAIVEQTNLE